MAELSGQWALTSASVSWGNCLQKLLNEEGRDSELKRAVTEISVQVDTGFQASSLIFTGANVVAGGTEMFVLVILLYVEIIM